MTRPDGDPALRKVMREAGQAGDHARFKVNQNPLFALQAVTRYRADEELPLWVRQWLLEVAGKMLRASLYWPARDGQPEYNPTFEEATDEALKAFGLRRQGWNAVAELHRFKNDDFVAWAHEELGVPKKELAEGLGVQPRQIRARVNRAKAKWPRIR